MKKLLSLALTFTLLFGMTACTGKTGTQSDENEPKGNKAVYIDFEETYSDEEMRAYAKSMIGTKAPDFTMVNEAGKQVSLSDYKGERVLLELAMKDCSVCVDTAPVLDEFKKTQTDMKLLQVYPRDTSEDIKAFYSDNGLDFNEEAIAGNGNETIFDLYDVKYVPSLYFIDEDGYIAYVHVGETDIESLKDIAEISKTSIAD